MPVVAMGAMVGGVLPAAAAPAATAVSVGYACAFYTNVSLFGGPYGSEGCGTQTSPYASTNSTSPSSSWTSGVPESVLDADGAQATYGPAKLLSSPYDANDVTTNTGALRAATSGTASVSATAKAVGVGPSPFYTATPKSFPISASPAGFVQAKCTASSPSSKSGSTIIRSGHVDTATDANGFPTNTVTVPPDAAHGLTKNYRVDFTIDNVGDHGHMIFNEHIRNADGSLTVNGAHMYLEGPTALGDMIISQVICGHA